MLIDGVFQLEYLENRGAAFGLFQGQRLFFFLSAGVILAIVVWFYLRVPMERRYLTLRILAVLIVAGAIGNFIDRLRLGYVVDFFYFCLIDFPIFNVAGHLCHGSLRLFYCLSCFSIIRRKILTEFFVEEKDSGQRIDQFLASRLEEVSRSQIQKMIRDHMITVSNKPVKANYRLLLHDRIQVEFPEPEVLNVLPRIFPLISSMRIKIF